MSVPSVPVEGARGTSELEQRLQMDFSKWDLGKKSASPEKVIKVSMIDDDPERFVLLACICSDI